MKVLKTIGLVVAIFAGLADITSFILAAIGDPNKRPYYIVIGIGLVIVAVLAIVIWFLVKWVMSYRARRAKEREVTDDINQIKKGVIDRFPKNSEEPHGREPSGQDREQTNSN